MLRASALFYAITVALLVGMVTSALILLVHFRNVETERWLADLKASANARSAVRLVAATVGTQETGRALDLFGTGEDSAFVCKRPYGLLDHVAARTRSSGRWMVESAFTGGRSASPSVLVVGRSDVGAVHLCGDARVLGNASVPNADVRRGYVEGRPFTGERLVEGEVAPSVADIELTDMDLRQRIGVLCRRTVGEQERWTSWEAAVAADTVGDPFASFPVVDVSGMRRLDGASLVGPLVLRSADTLVLGHDLGLDMVIVQAPFIIVEPEAVLSAQCFADRGIHVEQGARLCYPSALVVLAHQDGVSATIAIDADAVVEGVVLACKAPDARQAMAAVTTQAGSLVRGEVFSEGWLDHRGAVKGTAAADVLLLRTASSTYRGYLMDGTLAPPDPGIAIGTCVTGPTRCNDVLKWMPSVRFRATDA